MARAMLLCAGLGTRLRPLTDELPKPLVPIGDRALVAHVIEALSRQGVDGFVLNAHHLPEILSSFAKSLDIEAQVVLEAEILGTAGGIRGALPLLGPPPVLVHNGDILCDAPCAALLERASEGGLWLAIADRVRGEGSVGLDAAGHIVRLRGERFAEEARGGDYIGVCALGGDVLAELPERGCLIGDVALPRLRSGGAVGVVPIAGAWSDAGDPRSYLDANLAWLAAQGMKEWVAAGAEVEGELHSSIVGAGARVLGSGTVTRSVVWPGAVARAPLVDAIVTTRGRTLLVR
jgi:mannose-1-phosphate guanylyltransferase